MDFFKRLLSTGMRPGETETVSLIDIDRLTAPLSAENPSGEKDLEYDPAFIGLEEKIKGIPEVEIGGKIVQPGKAPDWHEILQDATELLTRTHDLRVALFLTRALLNTQGVVGMSVGLTLLQRIIERFWDTVYPRLAEEDNNNPTQRINILMGLCDRDSIIGPLLGATLGLSPKMGCCTLRDIQKAAGKLAGSASSDKPVLSLTVVEAIFRDTDLNALQAEREAAGESLVSLSSLESILEEKVGSALAPRFVDLRQVLSDVHDVLNREISKHPSWEISARGKKGERPLSVSTMKTLPERSASFQEMRPMDTINSRQDVIRILEQICLYYEKNEPASPVPLLLKRAARLVEKNFFEIIQDMAPESAGQIQKLIGGAKEKGP